MTFFDTNIAGELNNRLSEDIKKISEGIGSRVGMTVQCVARFIAAMIIAFIHGWKLALVILAVFPVMAITAGIMFNNRFY